MLWIAFLIVLFVISGDLWLLKALCILGIVTSIRNRVNKKDYVKNMAKTYGDFNDGVCKKCGEILVFEKFASGKSEIDKQPVFEDAYMFYKCPSCGYEVKFAAKDNAKQYKAEQRRIGYEQNREKHPAQPFR